MLRHTRHCITHHWSAAAGRAGEKARKARRVMETFLLTVLPRFNSDQRFRKNPGMHKNHVFLVPVQGFRENPDVHKNHVLLKGQA